jgi:tRNA-dihydrouridine synthase B
MDPLFSDTFPIVLAPMAGYTDAPFRMLCAKYGASGAYTELISASAVIRKNKQTLGMLQSRGEKYQLGAQLFGSKTEEIANAAAMVGGMCSRGACDAKFIDLNFGCPARKVVLAGAGSAILATPKKCGEIIEACVKKAGMPITAKIRLGYKSRNYLEVAKTIESAGASAICVHARTKDEGFGAKADWDAIAEVKNSVNIPVIGNGGISGPEDVLRMKARTGCDAAMVGRAALGNPFFFSRAKAALFGKEIPDATVEQKKKLFLDYLSLAEKCGCLDFGYAKAHAFEFARGFKGAAAERGKISRCKTLDEIRKYFS